MDKSDWQNIFRSLSLLTELGLIIVVNIGGGFFLGYLLDKLTGSQILFKIAGIILGVVSGFYSDYRLIKKLIGDNNDVEN